MINSDDRRNNGDAYQMASLLRSTDTVDTSIDAAALYRVLGPGQNCRVRNVLVNVHESAIVFENVLRKKKVYLLAINDGGAGRSANYKLFDIVFLASRIRHSLLRVAYPVLGDSGLTAILSSCISTEGTSIYTEAMMVTGLLLRIHFEDTTEMPLYLCIWSITKRRHNEEYDIRGVLNNSSMIGCECRSSVAAFRNKES